MGINRMNLSAMASYLVNHGNGTSTLDETRPDLSANASRGNFGQLPLALKIME
jgi:hypothetical protein